MNIIKKLLIYSTLLLMLGGCIATKNIKCDNTCPPTDIVTKLRVNGQSYIVPVPKGFFSNPKNFRTMEQYKEEMKKKGGI